MLIFLWLIQRAFQYNNISIFLVYTIHNGTAARNFVRQLKAYSVTIIISDGYNGAL